MTTLKDIPKLQLLVTATVAALKQLGGSASNEEIHDAVVELLSLPDEIVDFPHSSGNITRLSYRLQWARSYLKKVNAVDNTRRGVWTLTPQGRALSNKEVGDVVRKVQKQDAADRKARASSAAEDDADKADISDWQSQLLEVLGQLTPDAFERLCKLMLRESGFTHVVTTGGSGDGGIDGHGILRVNLVSFQVLFQAKRYKGSVGASVVRDFRGAMVGRADKGLIITTGTFTKSAREESRRDGAPAIDLVDGDDLCRLLKDLQIGVKVEMVEQVEIVEDVLRSI